VPGAVATQVIALGDAGTATLNYGFAELEKDYSRRKVIRVKNLGRTAASFTVSAGKAAGSPHRTKLRKTKVTIPARGETEVPVTFEVPAVTAGDSSAFHDVAGLVTWCRGRCSPGPAVGR
jgi:minor extracellular serine protease Vpr